MSVKLLKLQRFELIEDSLFNTSRQVNDLSQISIAMNYSDQLMYAARACLTLRVEIRGCYEIFILDCPAPLTRKCILKLELS